MDIYKDEFIELCKRLESAVEKTYGQSSSAYLLLMKQETFRTYWSDINAIREIRNLYQHNNLQIDGVDAFTLSQETVARLQEIVDLLENPVLVSDVYVSDLVYGTMEESVLTIMRRMRKNKVSHLPILDGDGRLVGVFSKTTLFSKLLEYDNFEVSPDQTMKEYRKYLGIKNHESEAFGFISLNTPVREASQRFAKRYEGGKRLVALYVTESGAEDEPIKGLVTPWDLLTK